MTAVVKCPSRRRRTTHSSCPIHCPLISPSQHLSSVSEVGLRTRESSRASLHVSIAHHIFHTSNTDASQLILASSVLRARASCVAISTHKTQSARVRPPNRPPRHNSPLLSPETTSRSIGSNNLLTTLAETGTSTLRKRCQHLHVREHDRVPILLQAGLFVVSRERADRTLGL